MKPEQRAERRKRERARMRRQRRLGVAGMLVVVVLLVAAGARPWVTSARGRPVVAASILAPQFMGPLLRPDRSYPHHETEASKEQRAVARFLHLGYPVYCGGGRRRLVALTFDDGPGPWSSEVVRILAHGRARATFFLVGRQIASFPRGARLEKRVGVLGDHTWSHPFFNRLKRSEIKVEVEDGRWALNRLAGASVFLFRAPYGEHTAAVDTIVRSAELLEVLWSVDSRDYVDHSWRAVGANVVSNIRPGSIVLMHELHPHTIAALRLVVMPALRRRHLWPVTVPELLAKDPPSLAQLRAGVRGCRA